MKVRIVNLKVGTNIGLESICEMIDCGSVQNVDCKGCNVRFSVLKTLHRYMSTGELF